MWGPLFEVTEPASEVAGTGPGMWGGAQQKPGPALERDSSAGLVLSPALGSEPGSSLPSPGQLGRSGDWGPLHLGNLCYQPGPATPSHAEEPLLAQETPPRPLGGFWR